MVSPNDDFYRSKIVKFFQTLAKKFFLMYYFIHIYFMEYNG